MVDVKNGLRLGVFTRNASLTPSGVKFMVVPVPGC